MNKRQFYALAALMTSVPATAFAYVDPGTGTLLVQGLIALIGAVVVFVKNPIASIKALVARLRKK
jgi:hypothetical protein